MSEITGKWPETKASYRFFANEKVTKDKILDPHIQSTKDRIEKSGETVLAIQDTTYLDYTHHPKTEGLGKLTRPDKSRNPLMGLVVHNTLAITTTGVPLGLLDQKIYLRGDEDVRRTQWNKKRPIEKKESFRWVEVVRKVSSHFQDKSLRIVHVCDREGDIYEFFHEFSKNSHEFLIRAASNRIIKTSDKARCRDTSTIWKQMELQPVAGTIKVEKAKNNTSPKRKAICEVRNAELCFKVPQRHREAKSEDMAPTTMSVIWVKEINSPPNTKPLEWMLLTNIKINTFKDAVEKIDWYKERWHIENFHKILKSGCNVEKSKLNHCDKLEKFATLMSVIAFRIYQLKLIGRNSPNTSCDEILTEEEWKILYCYVQKTNILPERPPSTYEAMIWIATLGGFLGRKGDGNPGSIVIWRGWQRFMDIMDGWKAFQLGATSG